MYAMIKLLS